MCSPCLPAVEQEMVADRPALRSGEPKPPRRPESITGSGLQRALGRRARGLLGEPQPKLSNHLSCQYWCPMGTGLLSPDDELLARLQAPPDLRDGVEALAYWRGRRPPLPWDRRRAK